MNENNDIMILDAVERYIRGEMNPDERLHFENLRKTNSEVDQLVVEHTLFLQQMNRFGEWQKFQNTLNEVHTDLAQTGKIHADKLKGKAKLVYLWNRSKRVTAIAASIAGITALAMSGLIWSISPKNDTQKLQALSRDLDEVKIEQQHQKSVVNNLQDQIITTPAPATDKPAAPQVFKSGGTGFIIDGKGLLVTNAHVVKNAKNIAVQNRSGAIFNAVLVYSDVEKDLAILKIEDQNFKPMAAPPYAFSKSSTDLAEPVYTLGYPRDEIVYGQGYLSAKTGYNGDTLSCQIAIAANPGNSGGPVLNHEGEVIGILSTREAESVGVVFALQSKHIYKALNDMKTKDSAYSRVKLSSKSSISYLDRTLQVKKIEDYVFMVKAN
ncbi:serine protease [Terrimonas sp. NA20]|uniref:Serine protease n=1 Tax=Terrimonas ginsenosidimutans TaxID=2908004 RepID=A0ABS9KTD8_9BACT|nr:serine protease [Terrimonas ginsenosidimutans]MCG2615592.1 serine protease [Terrimonas ginsenosidimutans]